MSPTRPPTVDLVLAVKPLHAAKTRLRGAADNGVGDPTAHSRLTLAIVLDTVAAARSARHVGRVLVVTSDPDLTARLTVAGVSVVGDGPEPGLNAAFEHGAALLRRQFPAAAVGALQADLPALRGADLDAAIEQAFAVFATSPVERVYCADAHAEGTTLLVSAPRTPLGPMFGVGSAARHALSGARPLVGDWPGLRLDVDTSDDLRGAVELGVGPETRALVSLCANGR